MAFRRTPPALPAHTETVTAEAPVGNALVAAASPVKLDAASLRKLKVADQEWQREAWRHYDICGELRFLSNRQANAASRVRIYIADMGEDGRPGDPTKDPDMQALSQVLLGGFMQRAKMIMRIALGLYVAGECFLVAESGTDEDLWYVVSQSEIRKKEGALRVTRPDDKGGGELVLRDGKDMLIRVWTPHPRQNNIPDSSVRAALPILREIERLTLLTFSEIDSRLISAGLLLLPQGTDFPHEEGKQGGVQGLLEMLLEAAKAQLQGAGTAAGLVPLIAEIPDGKASDVHHIKFETNLTAELQAKLTGAITRLATALDAEPEDLLGHGKVNHWSGWLIDEITIKLYVEPIVATICEALTTSCVVPYAKSKGLDPKAFTVWFDSSGLTVRPNRLNDAKDLWDRGVITDDTLRLEANFDDADQPSKAEQAKWMLWKVAQANQTILANPQVAKILGLPVLEELAPPPPPPQFPPGMDPNDPNYDPNADPNALGDGSAPGGAIEQGGQGAGAQQGGETRGIPKTDKKAPAKTKAKALTASGALLPGAEQAVLRALELAGGRLLDRHTRGQYGDVAKAEMHTRRPASDTSHARALLAGAWTHLPTLAAHHELPTADLETLLEGYCTELLTRGRPHDANLLEALLERAAAYRD